MIARRQVLNASDHDESEGPFVSFTDLFVGVLFLFLILVAALIIMQRASAQMARKDTMGDPRVIKIVAELKTAEATIKSLNDVRDHNLQDIVRETAAATNLALQIDILEKQAAEESKNNEILTDAAAALKAANEKKIDGLMSDLNVAKATISKQESDAADVKKRTDSSAATVANGRAELDKQIEKMKADLLEAQKTISQLNERHTADADSNEGLGNMLGDVNGELDRMHALDKEHPPFRLAMAYNVYRSDDLSTLNNYASLHFVQTVRIFKTESGLCLENDLYDYGGDASWGKADNFVEPSAADDKIFRGVQTCSIAADGEIWSNRTSEVSMKRVSDLIYEGYEKLHFKNGTTVARRRQYQILGIYDNYFKLNR